MSAHPGCITEYDTPARGESARPLPDERGLGALRTCVGSRTRVPTASGLQVVEVEALCVHATGSHGDHARRRCPLQERPQPGDQDERSHDEDGERRLDPVRALDPLRVDRPGVVDDHVEARLSLDDPGNGGSHRRQRAHVGDHEREAVLAVASDELVAQPAEPLLAAPDEDDPRP